MLGSGVRDVGVRAFGGCPIKKLVIPDEAVCNLLSMSGIYFPRLSVLIAPASFKSRVPGSVSFIDYGVGKIKSLLELPFKLALADKSSLKSFNDGFSVLKEQYPDYASVLNQARLSMQDGLWESSADDSELTGGGAPAAKVLHDELSAETEEGVSLDSGIKELVPGSKLDAVRRHRAFGIFYEKTTNDYFGEIRNYLKRLDGSENDPGGTAGIAPR